MNPYPKIQSIYKRDHKTNRFIEGDWSLPEFGYLAGSAWEWTEKIDGTNIRVIWDGSAVEIKGRTDKAQLQKELDETLRQKFTLELLAGQFPEPPGVTLYGEGYGRKIQKAGSLYLPDGTGFILFDVKVGSWWLKREDVYNIAEAMDIPHAAVLEREGSIFEAIEYVRSGPQSVLSAVPQVMEGLVLRNPYGMLLRNGQRIITKLKVRDFLYE